MKRKWLVVSVVAATLTVASVGGAVFATSRQGVPSPAEVAAQQKASQDRLFEKVGVKLGLDAAKVKDAHSQAVKAIERESRVKALNQLVTQGRLTREQADALSAWMDSTPDALHKAPGIRGIPGLPGLGSGIGIQGAPQQEMFRKMAAVLGKDATAVEQAFKDATKEMATGQRNNALSDRIDQLVKDGVLTEPEASELKAWVANAPAFLSDGSLQSLPRLPFKGQPGEPGRGGMPGPQRHFEFRAWPGADGRHGFQFNFGPDGVQQFGLTGPDGRLQQELQFRHGLDYQLDGLPDLFRQFGIPWQGLPDWVIPANPEPVAPPAGRGA